MKLDVASITNVNAGALLERGLEAIRAGDLAVDLSAVTNVDSAAVALLLAWQRAAAASGKNVTFSGVPPGVVSLAELYSVHELLHLGTGAKD